MWKKVFAGTSVLALVMVALAGAVYAQAENAEPKAWEKIDGKIADYKVAHPEWTKRLKSPTNVLALGISALFAYYAAYYGFPFAVGVVIGYVGIPATVYIGIWPLPGQRASYLAGYSTGRALGW